MEMLIRTVKEAKDKTKKKELATAEMAKDICHKPVAAASHVASPAFGTAWAFQPTATHIGQSNLDSPVLWLYFITKNQFYLLHMRCRLTGLLLFTQPQHTRKL